MINFIAQFSTTELVYFSVLAVALLVQMFYYLFIYGKVGFGKVRSSKTNNSMPLSVIVCAKNEEDNLQRYLPKILTQKYPDFEVVVVNDCSADNTEMVLAQMEQTYKNLRHTNIDDNPKFSHGKKLAISIGIKSAKHEHLVFIDADCFPESELWLQNVANAYVEQTQIVLGYGKYKTTKGFLNKLIRFDTLMIALQYIGMAKRKKAYMGVGRNLSYKKSLFTKGKGFSSHYHILSGDDDLFVNQNANKTNTNIVVTKDSFTCSVPSATFKEWRMQKKRHLSVGHLYKKADKIRLILEPVSKMLFYLAFIALLFTPYYWVALSVYGFRLLMQLIIIKLGMNKLNEKGILLYIPIFDLLLPLFNLFLIRASKKSLKNKQWR